MVVIGLVKWWTFLCLFPVHIIHPVYILLLKDLYVMNYILVHHITFYGSSGYFSMNTILAFIFTLFKPGKCLIYCCGLQAQQ